VRRVEASAFCTTACNGTTFIYSSKRSDTWCCGAGSKASRFVLRRQRIGRSVAAGRFGPTDIMSEHSRRRARSGTPWFTSFRTGANTWTAPVDSILARPRHGSRVGERRPPLRRCGRPSCEHRHGSHPSAGDGMASFATTKRRVRSLVVDGARSGGRERSATTSPASAADTSARSSAGPASASATRPATASSPHRDPHPRARRSPRTAAT